MEHLPAELTIDILSRLPVKAIVHCKLVCKKWRNLVLDHSFVDLHLSRSPTVVILHELFQNLLTLFSDPGTLNWMEIEDKVGNHHLHHQPSMSLDLNVAPILRNCLIDQMGSVNGLIFLWQHFLDPKCDDACICNPVTREIMNLPRQRGYGTRVYGFGVSSLTGEYKVVRTFKGDILLEDYRSSRLSVFEVEVYTLGTGQWRSLGRSPYRLNGSYLSYGTFLNDHCHWIVYDEMDAPEKIWTFDLNKETFQLFPSPPSEGIEEGYSRFQNLVVLKGCLCKYDAYDSQLTIWMMKEYGIKKSWHKEVVIKEAISRGLEWPLREPVSLIDGVIDGRILIVNAGSVFVFYPRSDTIECIQMFDYSVRGLAYRPSFLRLQNFESERIHLF